jgi:hypothetical protein
MDVTYLCRRLQQELSMARDARTPSARLIHFDLAGRYSLALAATASEVPTCSSSPGSPTSFHAQPDHLRAAA